MRKINFLSQTPNAFIFQKESNKTNFGGFLSVIYLIIALFIFLYLRAIYGFSEQYQITYFVSEEKTITPSEQTKFAESKKYNPILPMKFSLVDEHGKELSDRFIIVDYLKNITIERNKIIYKRANDINFDILYKCDDNNDTNKTQCEIDDKEISLLYSLVIRYQGFYFDPQSAIPINQLFNDTFHSISIPFNPDIKLRKKIRWTITRYEDNNCLFQIFNDINGKESEHIKESNIFIGGNYEEFDTMIISKNSGYRLINNAKLLLIFDSLNLEGKNTVLYNDYKRKEKSILDCYANIFSLWISLYNGFVFVFLKLYSKSFDQYKIMENILSKQKENIIQNKKQIYQKSKINEISKGDILMKDLEDLEEEYNDRLLIKEKKEMKDIETNDINDNDNFIKKEDEQDEQERILPKLRFLDFIFNTFYKENNCYSKRQPLICACSKIIFQYYSIENILYNQIMIENLLQDYKWNNPKLKNIFNNNSFNDIKNKLSNNFN